MQCLVRCLGNHLLVIHPQHTLATRHQVIHRRGIRQAIRHQAIRLHLMQQVQRPGNPRCPAPNRK